MAQTPERVGDRHRDADLQGFDAQRPAGPDDRDRTATDGESSADSTLAREAAIDDALEITFPASDAPAWISSGVGRVSMRRS